MARILYRSLIGHEDLDLGFGKVTQERGPNIVDMQRIQAIFIFETVDVIKALVYTKYPHVGLHQIGAVIEYYFDPNSMAVPDDVLILLPNAIHISKPGRYIRVSGGGTGGGGGDMVYTYTDVDYVMGSYRNECVLVDSDVGPITITLPPNPEVDDYAGVWDCNNNAGVNNISIVRNGKPIDGLNEDALINTNNGRFDFIWSPLTWKYSFVAGCLAGGDPLYYDTIVASASSEYKPLEISTSLPATTFRASFALSLAYIRISLTTAVEGADLIVDLKMNGVSVFSSPLHIDDGMDTSVGSATPPVFAVTDVPDDAKFTVWITQVGTTVEGTGLKISVTGIKVPI